MWRLINHSPKIIKILLIIFIVTHLDWQLLTHSDVSRQILVIVTSLGFNTHVLFIGVSYHSWATSASDKPNSFPCSVALLPCFSCRSCSVLSIPSQKRSRIEGKPFGPPHKRGTAASLYCMVCILTDYFGCACKRSDLVSRVSATNIFFSHFFT